VISEKLSELMNSDHLQVKARLEVNLREFMREQFGVTDDDAAWLMTDAAFAVLLAHHLALNPKPKKRGKR
jgi:hypothetical protein